MKVTTIGCFLVIGCCISSRTVVGQDLPNTAILNAEILRDAKSRIAETPDLWMVDTLAARADKFLREKIVTVVDKDLVPPSGDKHDYLTLAPYFWPNPDTPDGLPYVKRDGEVHEPNRSGTDYYTRGLMDNAVITLAIAYYLLEDEHYAVKAAAWLRAWFLHSETRMNPHLNFAQGVPGVMDGSLWGIIDTWAWPAIVDAVRLIEPSTAWTEEDGDQLAAWFDEYQTWLRTSELGIEESLMWNNHGSFYDAQVAALAIYAGKEDIAKSVLLEARNRRINHGIEPDGRQLYELDRTRSFAYSGFNLRAFFHLAALADLLDMDLWNYTASDGSGIKAALDYLAMYCDPDTEWPHLDILFDRTRMIPMLRWAAYVYDDPGYLDVARKIPGYSDYVTAFPTRVTDIPQLFLNP